MIILEYCDGEDLKK